MLRTTSVPANTDKICQVQRLDFSAGIKRDADWDFLIFNSLAAGINVKKSV